MTRADDSFEKACSLKAEIESIWLNLPNDMQTELPKVKEKVYKACSLLDECKELIDNKFNVTISAEITDVEGREK